MESFITTLTQVTNVQINDEFVNRVNCLVGEYYKYSKNVVIPEEPIYPDLKKAWINEILNEAILSLTNGNIIFLDGRMRGQIIYNLAIGYLLSSYLRYGTVNVIGDSDSQELFDNTPELTDESITQLRVVESIESTEGVNEEVDPSIRVVTLDQAISYALRLSYDQLLIDASIDPTNSIVQVLLGIGYYKQVNVTYFPEVSDPFIEFIVKS